MNSTETSHAGTPQPADLKLKRWKRAVAIGGLVVMAPVMAFVVLVLIAFALPPLALGVPFLAFPWFHRPVQAPRAPLAPPRTLQAPQIGPTPSAA